MRWAIGAKHLPIPGANCPSHGNSEVWSRRRFVYQTGWRKSELRKDWQAEVCRLPRYNEHSMNLFTLPPPKVEVVLLVVLLAAAVFDVFYRRIPNWLTVGGVVLGIVTNALIGPPLAGVGFAMAGLGVAFGIYVLLYAVRAMGAGDVKLMAAVGAHGVEQHVDAKRYP